MNCAVWHRKFESDSNHPFRIGDQALTGALRAQDMDFFATHVSETLNVWRTNMQQRSRNEDAWLVNEDERYDFF
jgi:hypothetical protein